MNTKIDWVRKLTSRKFWVAVANMVAGYVLAFGGSENTAMQITGLIMSTAAVVGYLLAEGLADSTDSTERKEPKEESHE